LNKLQERPEWKSTAVVIAYDDSDGWYDHQMSPILMHSASPDDALTGPGLCGTPKARAHLDRCRHGPRQPLPVISPFAQPNCVDRCWCSRGSRSRTSSTTP